MARYVSLIRFTPQGVRAIKKSPARAAVFRAACEKSGVTVEAQLWTAGAYDGILILNGNSEAKVLGAIAKLGAIGNVTTQTLQAFEAKEFSAMVGR